MDDKNFEQLMEALKEGADIIAGRKKPARVTYVEVEVDAPPQAVRKKLGLSQPQFARFLGVTPATLRNWEQKRRRIPPVARTLLRVADKHPEAVLDVLR